MPDFYTVVTDVGLQALGLATTQGQSFSLTQAVVGDGNGLAVIPNKGMANLVNEVWRGDVAGIKVDHDDPNTLIFEFAIPADTGGFTIREVGLLDESGKLFCIGNFPDTEKPVAADGSVRDLVVRLPLHFENADVVSLVINAAIVLATKQDILDHNADPQAHRLATTAETGFVRLATDEEHIAHQRKTVAATPWGVWKLAEALKSDAVDLASSLRLATSQAVKSVMDALTLHTNDTGKHVPSGGSTGDALLKNGSGTKWTKLALVPVGHVDLVPFRPDALPPDYYMLNGDGLLKTSEAGKTLLSMPSTFKSDWGVTENSTHIFLPNVFSGSDGYFFRAVNGSSRRVGNKQGDAIREISGTISSYDHTFDGATGAFRCAGGASGTPTGPSGSGYADLNFYVSRVVPTAHENRPKNIGMTPVIYLPPLGV